MQTLSQSVLIYEVFEQILTIHCDDRDPLEVGAVQSLIGSDVQLGELEVEILLHTQQHSPRLAAQVAVRLCVQRNETQDGRSPVA